MNMTFSFGCSVLAVVAFPVSAASLCKAGETELFQCFANQGRTAAVCQLDSAAAPALVYRFGRPGRIELEFPRRVRPASEVFTKNYMSWPKGTSSQLGFSVGPVRYTVYSWSSSFEGEHSGVLVEQPGKKMRDVNCRAKDWVTLAAVQALPLPEHEYRSAP
jgi:hypothetical protein